MTYSALSLDLGAKTGFALITDGVIVQSGERDHKLKKGEPEGTNFLKFLNFLNEYSDVNEIYFEQIDFIMNRLHAWSFIPFESTARIFALNADIKVATLTPGQWRSYLTGKSRGSEKGKEKFRICAKLHSVGWKGGMLGTDKANNEADAIGLAFGIHKVRGKELSFKTA